MNMILIILTGPRMTLLTLQDVRQGQPRLLPVPVGQSIAMIALPPAAAAITVPLATSDRASPVADRPTSA